MSAFLSTLTMIVERARLAADYSRFAGLPLRYLDDAGLTPSELDVAIEHGASAGSLAHSV